MQQQPEPPPRGPQPINIGAIALVIIVIVIWAIGRNHSAATAASTTDSTVGVSSATGDPATASPTITPDTCDAANKYENQSAADLNAHDYSGAYHNAVSGLAKNDSCGDDSQHTVNEGYLLSIKGLAEQHLSVGDSRTDLNQAGMVLQQCVTKPGLYGTSTGAGCETQQQNDIRAEDNAEMNGQ
jgi:hypothetical protein